MLSSIMKKDQNSPNENIHSNKSSRKTLPYNYNNYRKQSLYRNSYLGRSPD